MMSRKATRVGYREWQSENGSESGMVGIGRHKRTLLWTTLFGLLLFFSGRETSIAQLLRQIIQTTLPVALKDANGLALGVNALAIDSSSRVWLTLRGRHSLGMISASACATQSDCRATEFLLPNGEAIPKFVGVDRQGDVWVTAVWPGGHGLVYKFDPDTATFVEYLAPGEDPFDIAVDSHGKVWFTDFAGGTINSLSPGSGLSLEEYQAPAGQQCRGLAIDANDVAWSTCGTTLVRYYRSAIRIQQDVFVIPKGIKPFGIIVGDPGYVWFIDQHASRLFRFDDATDSFTSWIIPSLPDSDPLGAGGITVDPHWLAKKGDVIYYTGFTGVLGTFNVKSQTFGSYLFSPSRVTGSGAYDIAVDRGGRVWFTEVNANKLSRLYEFSPQLPPPPGLNPQPL